MGGFQPFLRARRQFHMVAKLMLVDGPKRQTAAWWDRYRPVPKRSETAQLFLISTFLLFSCANKGNSQPVSLPLRPATAVP